jgi:hypothetical protein
MKEAEFLGGLLPSHPDFEPIIEAIRAKYGLPELYPQDEPIQEIFLDDEIVTLEQFTQDVKNYIIETMETIFPDDFVKKYRSAKLSTEFDYQKELEKFDEDHKPGMKAFFEFTKTSLQTVYRLLDASIDEVVATICNYLLLGDSMEAPQDWFGKVFTMKSGEDTIIYAAISELTNLDLMFQQIKSLYNKTYRRSQIKITPKTANTAYYLQLARRNKDRDFILDEFIRLNGLDIPKNENSQRYADVRKKYWQRLRKRLKKAEAIMNAIAGGKK